MVPRLRFVGIHDERLERRSFSILHRRNDREVLLCTLEDKPMLFEDRLGRPPSGPIELDYVAVPVLVFEAVDPIDIARIWRDDSGQTEPKGCLDAIHDGFG